MTPRALSAVLPFLSALPTGTPVNVNTALPEVLAAIVEQSRRRAARGIDRRPREKAVHDRCRVPGTIAGGRDACERRRAAVAQQLFP